ncbi:MAG: SDR family NAD(P)-dependent oxidoreductase [Chloroflexi bacterium]|nr:SDR family NAD(P)-dependent oxidoreductase [Chloroflexota bacterium]
MTQAVTDPATVSALKGARVLVTGGCGFIGSHLVEALVAQDAVVWVVDNLQAGTQDNLKSVADRVSVLIGDVRDSAFVNEAVARSAPQYVFHLAANASVPGSVKDPAYDFETNSGGAFVLLNALRTIEGCEKVILASSGAVYGEPQAFPITEETPVRPISPYGASKAGAEISARMFHDVYGLPVVIARIFNTYGPRMARFVILDFLRKLQRDPNVLEVLGTGQQKRDFNYITDAVEGLLILAGGGKVPNAYNLSSGQSISVAEMALLVISALCLSTQTRIVYTGSSWIGDAQRWEVSIAKLCDLGYAPRVTLDDGLRRTIDWFRTIHLTPRPEGDSP